jgi:lysozyme family protein
MHTFADTKGGYGNLWDHATVYSPKVNAVSEAKGVAERILKIKTTLQTVEGATGVPWWWVGCALYREADLSLNAYLGNGQSLHSVTTEVPAGRGPFSSFLAGAEDAIEYEFRSKGITPPKVWTVEFALWFWEVLNGQGYFSLNVNSPYVWNWTDLYNGGKYIADHDFSRSEWDVQGGCAAILKALLDLDSSIVLARENAPLVLKQPPQPQVPATIPVQPTLPAVIPAPTTGTDLLSVLQNLIAQPLQVQGFLTKLTSDLTNVINDANAFSSSMRVPTPPTQGTTMPTPSTPPTISLPSWLANWQTTSAGAATFAISVGKLLTDISTKNFVGAFSDAETLIGLIGGLGLIFAKDAGK